MTTNASRREFMRRATWLAGAGAATPLALNLAALGNVSAQSATDYKALVCIFLYGGNDHHNTIVPLDDATHAQYSAIRTGIALPLVNATTGVSLAATELVPDNAWADGRTEGRRMALNPSMTGLKSLFDQGKLALAMNTGPLVRPLTDYKSTPPADLPPKLFSHNDQQSVWQSGRAEGATTGWGGRMADLLLDANTTRASFASISAAGNAVFMAGEQVVQYQVSTSGAIAIKNLFGNQPATEALKTLMRRSSAHHFEADHAAIAGRSFDAQVKVSEALANAATQTSWFSALDTAIAAGNGLAAQLKVVAQLIASRADLGVRRQVFFVSLGGFDLHDSLPTKHSPLLGRVSEAMAAFYASTALMGMQDQVTSFTASDFGRTLSSNGDGSDHGWGSYHFVMGGSVQGRRWYGQLPVMSLAKADDPVGSGRLIPAISVDQYAATLGRWFGVPETELGGLFPNLSRFASADVGFMAPPVGTV